jgi:hypothetical protein
MEFASKDSLMKAGILIAVLLFIYYIASGSPNNVPCSASSDCAGGQYCGVYQDGAKYCLPCPTCIDSSGDPTVVASCTPTVQQCTANQYCGLSNTYFDSNTGETANANLTPSCQSCSTSGSCGYKCSGADPSTCSLSY